MEVGYNRFKFPGEYTNHPATHMEYRDHRFQRRLVADYEMSDLDNLSDDLGINARLRYRYHCRKRHLVRRESQHAPRRYRATDFRTNLPLSPAKIRYTFRFQDASIPATIQWNDYVCAKPKQDQSTPHDQRCD
ncbi:MAG: hypothetical protein U5K38_17055 [Woeseiaceae bacterium]|nr:hypothetical protein [Woeseiaceae bacterium]